MDLLAVLLVPGLGLVTAVGEGIRAAGTGIQSVQNLQVAVDIADSLDGQDTLLMDLDGGRGSEADLGGPVVVIANLVDQAHSGGAIGHGGVHDHTGNHLVVVGVDTDALVSGFGNQVQLCLHRLSGTQDDGVHALVDHVLEEVRPLGVAVINDILEGPAPHLAFQLTLEDGALLALDFGLGMDASDFQGPVGLDRRACELVEGTGVGAGSSRLAVGGGGCRSCRGSPLGRGGGVAVAGAARCQSQEHHNA